FFLVSSRSHLPGNPRGCLDWSGLSCAKVRRGGGRRLSATSQGDLRGSSAKGVLPYTHIRLIMEAEVQRLGRVLRLTEDEGRGLRLSEDLWEGAEEGNILFLVGRVLASKDINFEGLARSLKDMLNPVKGMNIKSLPKGRFVLRFNHVIDKKWTLDGCPWSFEKQLEEGQGQALLEASWVSWHSIRTSRIGRAMACTKVSLGMVVRPHLFQRQVKNYARRQGWSLLRLVQPLRMRLVCYRWFCSMSRGWEVQQGRGQRSLTLKF
ncbi:hypothetical protein Salat_1118200, partial [Sesamum alatum]